MRAGQVADRCLDETGAGRMSGRAKDVALIAIATAVPDRRKWRRAIRDKYVADHPECGSVFLIIILPILISLISQWLAKWLFKESPAMLASLQEEARSALGSSPR